MSVFERNLFCVAALMLLTLPATAEPKREAIPGTKNYTRVDATVACGGATATAAFPALRAEGFKAIINLRQADEPGADVEQATRAAEAAGLKYLHIPFSSSSPSTAAVDTFLAAMRDPANSPVYIHCGSANRVGAVWIAKRMLLDGWDEARAVAEAEKIGLKSPTLRDFALAYVREHQPR